MGAFEPPSNVGFRVGIDGPIYAALQIHYNNIAGTSGLTDSSGVSM